MTEPRNIAALDFLTTRQAAALLNFSPSGVYALIERGQLLRGVHFHQLPTRTLRFHRGALLAWVRGEKPDAIPAAPRVEGSRVNLSLLGAHDGL